MKITPEERTEILNELKWIRENDKERYNEIERVVTEIDQTMKN
jgi:hypothetical protein